MLLWNKDPLARILIAIPDYEERPEVQGSHTAAEWSARHQMIGSVVLVPFNPTAEQMALYLLNHVGPIQLADTGVYLTKVIVEETRRCLATASLA